MTARIDWRNVHVHSAPAAGILPERLSMSM